MSASTLHGIMRAPVSPEEVMMTGEYPPAAESDPGLFHVRRGASKSRNNGAISTLVFAVLAPTMLGVSGCWAPTTGIPGDPVYDQPLEVWFSGPVEVSPFVSFYVTRPAYVGIFEMDTQGHVRAVYPYDVRSTQRPVGPGLYAITRFTGGTPVLTSCAAPLMYRLIIASEQPLRLDRIRGDVAFALRPAPGSIFFAAAGFGGTLDRLVEDLVPRYAAGPGPEWATHWQTHFFNTALCHRAGSGPMDALLGARAIALLQATDTRLREPGRGTTAEETDEDASPIAPEPPLVPRSLPALEQTEADTRVAVDGPSEEGRVFHGPAAFRTPEPYRASDVYGTPVRLPAERLTESRGRTTDATWIRGGAYMPRDVTRLSGRDRGFQTVGVAGERSSSSRGFGSIRDGRSSSRALGSSRSSPRSPSALPSTRARSTGAGSARPTRGTSRSAPSATGSSGGRRTGSSGTRSKSGRIKPDGLF